MRISQTTFSLTKTSRNWNGGVGLLATLAIALAGFASTSYADSITLVPAGLVAGDTYRLVFVTADTYAATDSNIADYNAEVSAEANSVTALHDLDTTWSVIGSTDSVDAITNIGEIPGVPIYNLDGYLVADDATTNTGGLFSGSLLSPIEYDEYGTPVPTYETINQETPFPNYVWTGTTPSGDAAPGHALSFDEAPSVGSPFQVDSAWTQAVNDPSMARFSYYSISGALIVGSSTPEPATTATMIMGVAVLYLAVRRRQRVRRAN
jgi:hypothetical protein